MHLALIFVLSIGMLISPAKKPTAMDAAEAYAAASHHKLTVRHDHGYVWVEMEGSDIFGTGKTEEEAAEDFLSCADLLAHEPTDPAHAPAAFVCPDKAYCI